jgi:hypothetical protein
MADYASLIRPTRCHGNGYEKSKGIGQLSFPVATLWRMFKARNSIGWIRAFASTGIEVAAMIGWSM